MAQYDQTADPPRFALNLSSLKPARGFVTVVVSTIALIVWHGVETEKCRRYPYPGFCSQAARDAQHAQFRFQIQTVT